MFSQIWGNGVWFWKTIHTEGRMRTNIVIDDDLMAQALSLTQCRTKRAVVEEGLRLLVRLKKQEQLRSLRGKLKWEGSLEQSRLDQ